MAQKPAAQRRSRRGVRAVFGSALAGMTAIVFAATLGAGAAFAHDAVVNSDPADGATVDSLPREFHLEFSGEPKDIEIPDADGGTSSVNTVSLTREGTTDVLFSTQPDIEGRDLSFTLPDDVESIPDDYTVAYRITSSDGHVTDGRVSFTVANDATKGSDAASTGTDNISHEQDNGGVPVVGIIVAVLALAVVAAIVVVVVLRRRGNNDLSTK